VTTDVRDIDPLLLLKRANLTMADLSAYPHPAYEIEKISDAYSSGAYERLTDVPPEEATILSSRITGSRDHTFMIDVDVRASLVPSSTPGHSHLYIDVPVSWRKYKRVLRALVQAGVVEAGYYNASKKRGFTALRPPWRMK
jgi:hypothetical protein